MSTNTSELDKHLSNLQVFPNPASQFLSINLSFNQLQRGQIFVFNKIGKKIWQQTFSDKKANYQILVDNWTSGIYYLIIQTEKGIKTEEIVVVSSN